MNPINTLISLNISNIKRKSYLLDNSAIKGKILKVRLLLKDSFSATEGKVIFLQNQIFMSSQSQKILSFKYTYLPLTFKMGPLLISEDKRESNDSI